MKTTERIIAILNAEVGMIESHAYKLVEAAFAVMDEREQQALLQLADEETARAKSIRQHIVRLRNHLEGQSSQAA